MTINYDDLLTADQKRSIVSQRISQLAAEAYQHSLNKKSFEGIEDQSGVESSEKAMAILESALAVHKAELESLPAPAAE